MNHVRKEGDYIAVKNVAMSRRIKRTAQVGIRRSQYQRSIGELLVLPREAWDPVTHIGLNETKAMKIISLPRSDLH